VLDAGTEEGIIDNLWGSEGQLFFQTHTELGRLVGTEPELVIPRDPTWPRIAIRDVWGLSPTEVFVTASDEEFEQYACGGTFMLWFDGVVFHRF
jgi:hypothetical protein